MIIMLITIGDIIVGIIGALICAFICGGWYLLELWFNDVAIRRFEKKIYKERAKKEDAK